MFLTLTCRAMEKKQAEGKVKDLADTEDTLGDFSPAALPIDGGGGIAAGSFAVIPSSSSPDFDSESVCTVGPCRHYWELEAPIDTANPASYGELGLTEPRQTVRACMAQPGIDTQLSGDVPIYRCNQHKSIPAEEAAAQERHLRQVEKQLRARQSESQKNMEGGDDATSTDPS